MFVRLLPWQGIEFTGQGVSTKWLWVSFMSPFRFLTPREGVQFTVLITSAVSSPGEWHSERTGFLRFLVLVVETRLA